MYSIERLNISIEKILETHDHASPGCCYMIDMECWHKENYGDAWPCTYKILKTIGKISYDCCS